MTQSEQRAPEPEHAGGTEGGAFDRWEATRDEQAAREADSQEEADTARRERRAMHDLTRGSERGHGEATARLSRERASDDASREKERGRVQRARVNDHQRALQALAQEGDARVRAEHQSEALKGQATAWVLAQREALTAARQEIDVLEGAIDVLAAVAVGSPDCGGVVTAARRAVQRLDALLGVAMHGEDGGGGGGLA